eukprot:929027-Prymnesium_polylepis.2
MHHTGHHTRERSRTAVGSARRIGSRLLVGLLILGLLLLGIIVECSPHAGIRLAHYTKAAVRTVAIDGVGSRATNDCSPNAFPSESRATRMPSPESSTSPASLSCWICSCACAA